MTVKIQNILKTIISGYRFLLLLSRSVSASLIIPATVENYQFSWTRI